MTHVAYIVVIHEVMQRWSDKGGVCLVGFIESESLCQKGKGSVNQRVCGPC